jgi:hypothetical protein
VCAYRHPYRWGAQKEEWHEEAEEGGEEEFKGCGGSFKRQSENKSKMWDMKMYLKWRKEDRICAKRTWTKENNRKVRFVGWKRIQTMRY